MIKLKYWLMTLCCTMVVAGCATGQDYQSGVNTAQVTNTSVVKLIGIAAQNKLVTQKDANNLLKQVDVAQEGIEVANGLPPSEGADKLKQARSVLSGIIAYLSTKGVK